MKKVPKIIFPGKKGFTLLELLISTAIFSITVVIGISLFFTIVDIQKRASYVQAVQNDARYVMEEIARQLRQGYLDYEYYLQDDGSYDFDSSILAVKDLDNNRFYFERVHIEDDYLVDGTTPRYVLKTCSVDIQKDALNKCDNSNNWQTVTPDEVQVKNFLIFPTPAQDPFVLDEDFQYQAYDQPKVTIIFQTETDRREQKYRVSTNLQTTISTRVYAR